MKDLHKTIRQYRVVPTIISALFCWLMIDMWQFFKTDHSDLSQAASTGFIALALAVVGVLKFSLDSFSKPVHKDDDHVRFD